MTLDVLGEASLRSLFLAGVIQCALWLLRVRQAQLLLAAWTVVLAASISMPMLPQFIPLRFQLDWVATRPMVDSATELVQGSSLPPGDAVIGIGTPQSTGSLVETLYVVVGSIMLLRVALGVGLSWRLLARANPAQTKWAVGQRVRVSRDLNGAVTIFRTILLPIDVADWPTDMRQAVLAHEQSHVARWDFAMLIVSQLNRALFWFNPLSWWLHRRLVILTELTSDDQAMALTRDRLGYAEVLLRMARRSGPVFRGPAMARPSTLPQRIDRILLDHASFPDVSRLQQVMLMFGVTGLSLGTASLLPSVDLGSAVALPSTQVELQNEGTISSTQQNTNLETLEPSTAGEQVSVPENSIATLSPSSKGETPEPLSQSVAASPPFTSSTATQSSRATTMSAPRRSTLQTVTRNTSVLPPSRPMGRQTQVAIGHGGKVNIEALPARSTATKPPGETNGSDAKDAGGSQTGEAVRSSPSQSVMLQSVPQAGRKDVDSICVGTVTIGMRAGGNWPYSSPQKTTVVPGQKITTLAQFFHKADGTSWVRFSIFDRPPLDLPVRSIQGGMAWTGEYGIAYAVQSAGSNQLVGLAAPIASDSAKLDFSCSGSTAHLL